MSKIDDLIAKIRTEKIGQTGKRVLIVEGDDDVVAFQAFLNKKDKYWERTWVIAPAQGKKKVLDVLKKEPQWIGVIDCDEWSADAVQEAGQQRENLYVLSRFCIESYLINPHEIWSALPQKQQQKIAGGEAELKAEIEVEISNWIRHAALWHVIHPLYANLRESNHRDLLLDPSNVPDQVELKSVLESWLRNIEPENIAESVAAQVAEFCQLPLQQIYSKYLYAKKFYPMVVHAVLNSLLGQKTEKDRVQTLLRTLILPADLDPLWVKMGM